MSLEAQCRACTEVRYRLDHIAQGLHQSSSEYLQERGLTAFVEEPVLEFDLLSCEKMIFFLTSNQNSPCWSGCFLPLIFSTMRLQEERGSVCSLASH